MKIGVGVLFHSKLTEYLDMVKKRFSRFDIKMVEADFMAIPEMDARNNLLSQFAGYDYVFTIDSDEIILEKDQDKIIEQMVKRQGKICMCPVVDIAGKDKIYEQRGYMPIVMVKPELKFHDKRCMHLNNAITVEDAMVYHFGFIQSEEVKKWKIEQYAKRGVEPEYAKLLRRKVVDYKLPGGLIYDVSGSDDHQNIKIAQRIGKRTLHKSGNTGKVK